MKSMEAVRQERDSHIVGMEAGVRALHKRTASTATRGSMHPNPVSIEEAEAHVYEKEQRNPFILLVSGNVAAAKVFFYYLITLDTILSCGLCVGLTCYWYFTSKSDEKWFGGGMDWIIVAFAVVNPMTTSLSMAFRRREQALYEISRIRSFSFQIYTAHALWDWDPPGRAAANVDWLVHCDKVLAQLVGIGDELCRFLSLPTSSRSRNRMTRGGQKQAARIVKVAYRLFDSLATQRMARLTTYDERLKTAGLPATEVSRLRQYERFMGEAMENLRILKMYRTPQALRSFARIFTLILPAFYAPTFAQLARDVQSLPMGILFGLLIVVGLSGLFESIQVLEDPFVAFITLDGINVREEFEVLHWQQLVNAREVFFPDAPPFPEGTRTALSGDTIPELSRAKSAGKVHKKVTSWDQETLAEVGFGNYIGDLRSQDGDAMMRERLVSEDNGTIRISQFDQYLGDDDDEEAPAGGLLSASGRLLHRRGISADLFHRKEARSSNHSAGPA